MTRTPTGPRRGAATAGSAERDDAGSPERDDAGSPERDGVGSAWLLVARREIMVKLTDRAFLIGTLVTVGLMASVIGLQAFLIGGTHTHTLVADPAAVELARVVQRDAPGIDDTVRVDVRQVPDAAAARSALLDADADAWLHRGDGGWVLTTRSQPEDSLHRVVTEAVRAESLRVNAAALGTTVEALQRGTTLEVAYLRGDADRAMLSMIVGFAFSLLFYLATLLLGVTLANSVVEEKQSRIVEIIATAIPVRHLLAGKIVGNTALALLQLVLYLGVGLVGLAFTEYGSLLPALSGPVLWFLVFFLAGFVALACLWAAAGALASRAEDVQSTSTPLTLLTVGVFFGGFFLEGAWREVASYVPPLSAVLMPIRLLEGEAVWWQALLALGLLLLAAAGTVLVGERLYRHSLLQTGGRIGWRQAWHSED